MDKKYSLLFIILLISFIFLLIKPSSAQAETLNLQLQPGWNMVSLPVNITLTKDTISSKCSLASSIWHYNPTTKAYETVTTLYPGLGYWINVKSACTLTLTGNKITIDTFPLLKTGTNQIGSLYDPTDFSLIRGNCNILNGPVRYNTLTDQYEGASVLEPGLGYFVKVGGDCSLRRILSATDLVAYYKFDEGQGSIAKDFSLNKNDATLYNNPTWVTGKSGKALQFNGSNYVEAPNCPCFNLNSQVTITAWISPSTIGAYNRIVAKSYTSNANPWTEYGLLFDSANHLRLEIATNNQQNAVNGKTTIPLNTWTFVAGTYDGSTMKVYVNGNLDNFYSHTGPIDTDNIPLSIARSGFNSDYFKGKIDEVQVWNKALTADEIKSEYVFQTCTDGTLYGSCSVTQPKYCDNGTLINKCSLCGCLTGYSCQSDGSCQATACSSLTYPSDKWQRVWYTHSTGSCLGNTPDQTQATFDDNWSTGTIAYSKADDIQFSSSRTINIATAGTYTFTVGSDDGIKLWIDDTLEIDQWIDRSYTTNSVNLSLTAGNHKLRIDYYENGGDARASFSYSQTVTPGGLRGDYYDNIDFTNLKITRMDSTVNFDWGYGSPDSSISADTFSVRWQGYVKADYSETYTFYVTTDDGSRVWIDNQSVIDSWIDQAATEHSGTISLTQGWHTIKYEFYENGGDAVAKLSYSSPSTSKRIIPSDHLGTFPGVPSDLVAYWKLDEGLGSTAKDSSPNKNDATLYNSPVWTTGRSGKALQFNGANYIEAPDSSSLDLNSQVTITAWINPSSVSAYNRIVAKSYTSNIAPWTMYGLLFDNANHLRLEIATSGTQNAVNGVTTIPLNQWTFVAETYDGSTMKVYVNGVLDNSTTHTGTIDTNNIPLSIGRSGFGLDYFKGTIDEVKIWNRALSADEIKKEYGVQTCSADGTPYGSCSATKPLYCDNSGNLLNNYCYGPDKIAGTADDCGCSSGICQLDGSCQTAGCSSLSYPSDKWQRVWYTHSTGACLGNGPDQSSTTFDTDWSTGTIAYNQADDIEFRSSRTINLPAGTYTFTLGSDDGARLWIDDVLQIDKWVDRGYTIDTVSLQLTAGNHKFRIDWHENGGDARVSFAYTTTIATCDSQCKTQSFASGTCRAATSDSRVMGFNSFEWQHMTLQLVTLAKNSGTNTVRHQMSYKDWTNDIIGWINGEKYQAKNLQIRQWFRDNSITYWLDCMSTQSSPPEGYGNMQARVIFNTNGAGDAWISNWSQIIRALQPDIVGILNEPGLISGASEYPGVTQAQYYTAYRQFVIRAINAYKAIKPDLIITACSLPFYDFTAVATSPIPGVDFYEFHDYYSFDNSYPPSYEQGQRDYWNGNLALAKTEQYNRWLYSDIHLQAMFNAGLPVIISEAGTNNLNPNYLVFMQDFYDFAKTYNLGILQHEFRAWDPILGYYEAGILNSDEPGNKYASWSTLNDLGRLWANNMPKQASESCQSGETSIGQDGCSSGNFCCCK
jgi:hypothetical protein